MPKTRKELTHYCREWRKVTYTQKRFNKCLREYIETKYNVLFKEFRHFYQELDQANPEAKDITKTKQFKLWKKEQKSEQIPQRNNEQFPQRSDNDEQIPQQSDNDEQIPQQSDNDEQFLQRSDNESNEQFPQQSDNDEQFLQRSDNESNEQFPQQSDNDEQIPQRSDNESNEQFPQRSDSENDEQILQPNEDILSQALDQPLSPDNITIDQMDNLLREMISDLQQDDNIRALLDNEELFPPLDEGIDLDIEMEIDDPLQEELLW